jgi:hypothetical protein
LEEARALLRMDVTSVEGVTSTSLLEVSKPFHPPGDGHYPERRNRLCGEKKVF